MSEGREPFLISVLPPNPAQKRAALSVGLLLLVLFLATLPFAHVRLGQLEVFLPIAATIMFLTDSITATLLYAQFSVLRSGALLALANGYLFTGLVVVAYALTFPGRSRRAACSARACRRRPGSSRSGKWDCLRQLSLMQSWAAPLAGCA